METDSSGSSETQTTEILCESFEALELVVNTTAGEKEPQLCKSTLTLDALELDLNASIVSGLHDWCMDLVMKTIDVTEAIEEYNMFRKFIEKQRFSHSGKVLLYPIYSKFLFPTYLYLYLWLHLKKEPSIVKEFLAIYPKQCSTNYRAILEKCSNIEEAREIKVLNKELREIIIVEPKAFINLMYFLESNSAFYILRALPVNAQLKVLEAKESPIEIPYCESTDPVVTRLFKRRLAKSKNNENQLYQPLWTSLKRAKKRVSFIRKKKFKEIWDDIKHANQDEPFDLETYLWTIHVCADPKIITATYISPDLSYAAVGLENSLIYFWGPDQSEEDVEEDGTPHLIIHGHMDSITSLAMNLNYKLLLSASDDCVVNCWKITQYDKRLVSVYEGHVMPITHVCTSSAFDYFVSTSKDKSSILWNYFYSDPLRYYYGHTDEVNYAAIHPNCYYIATASADTTIRLYSFIDPLSIRLFTGHASPVNSIVFSPCGKFLASADAGGYVKVFDIGEGKEVSSFSVNKVGVKHICCSDDSKLATVGLDNSLRVFNIQNFSDMRGYINNETPPSSEWKSAYMNPPVADLILNSAVFADDDLYVFSAYAAEELE